MRTNKCKSGLYANIAYNKCNTCVKVISAFWVSVMAASFLAEKDCLKFENLEAKGFQHKTQTINL